MRINDLAQEKVVVHEKNYLSHREYDERVGNTQLATDSKLQLSS